VGTETNKNGTINLIPENGVSNNHVATNASAKILSSDACSCQSMRKKPKAGTKTNMSGAINTLLENSFTNNVAMNATTTLLSSYAFLSQSMRKKPRVRTDTNLSCAVNSIPKNGVTTIVSMTRKRTLSPPHTSIANSNNPHKRHSYNQICLEGCNRQLPNGTCNWRGLNRRRGKATLTTRYVSTDSAIKNDEQMNAQIM